MERLFLGSPALRRNFIDRLIYGTDKDYLNLGKNKIKSVYEAVNTENFEKQLYFSRELPVKHISLYVFDFANKKKFLTN